MKKSILILAVIFFTFVKSYSQNIWEKTNGPDTATTTSLAVDSNGYIFAATDDGIFRSVDDGDTWLNLGINKGIRLIYVDTECGIFITTNEQGPVLYSSDNGSSWDSIGLTSWQNSIAVNSAGNIFAGTDNFGIYCKTNSGGNWIQMNNGLTDLHITSLKINSNQDILVGTIFEGMFRSSDNGHNWVQINQGLTSNYITSLATNSEGYIFAGTSGNGVFRSTNYGENWTESNNGITGESRWIQSITINTNGDIFLGTAVGVFRSTNGGDNWFIYNEGLSNKDVRSLAYCSDGKILAGTCGGIFRRLCNLSSTNPDPNKIFTFELNQNFPNPFNPDTRIGYKVALRSQIRIEIFDILGNKISELVNQEKEPGEYSVIFDAAKLSGGVYFYRIQAENNEKNYVQTRKMTLLK